MIHDAEAGRAAGFLARQRITKSATDGGNSGRRRRMGTGVSASCAASVARNDDRAKGGAPVNNSYATHPKA